MKITQIRNATLHVEYAGSTFLVDPMLAEKGAYPGFPGTVNSHLSNPLVGLPMRLSEITDVDAMIVTHTHPDHWDDAAKSLLPKDLPVFVQNESDRQLIRSSGFTDVSVLTDDTTFNGVKLIKTPGQHGSDEAYKVFGEIMGEVCGVVFDSPDEKRLYLAGDTVWNQFVIDNLKKYKPDVIVLNCGDARADGMGSILMGKHDVLQVCKSTPSATVIASHMEAVNHCVLSRTELREFLDAQGHSQQVLIPGDGEACQL